MFSKILHFYSAFKPSCLVRFYAFIVRSKLEVGSVVWNAAFIMVFEPQPGSEATRFHHHMRVNVR